MQQQASPSSNPFLYCLPEEDAASVAALQGRAARCKARGFHELAWGYSCRALEIVNRAMLKKMREGDSEDGPLYYTEMPSDYPERENIGLDLDLRLIAGSPLAQKIVALLEEDAKRGSIL